MNIIYVCGMVAGIALGFRRLNFFTLFPLIATAIGGTAAARWFQPTLTELIAAAVLPQVGYLLGLMCPLGARSIFSTVLRAGATMRVGAMLRCVRTAIGQELRDAFEIPQNLPDEIARLVKQMQAAA